MKNNFIFLIVLLSTIIVVACKKDPILAGYVFAMDIDLEYLDQNGVSLFANNQIKPDRNNLEVTYIINGKPINFYQIKETIEHSLVPFLYFDDNGKKIIRLFMNDHLTENKSTTIIKLNGFPADTLFGEFYVDETNKILNKCIANNKQSYNYGEIITLIK